MTLRLKKALSLGAIFNSEIHSFVLEAFKDVYLLRGKLMATAA